MKENGVFAGYFDFFCPGLSNVVIVVDIAPKLIIMMSKGPDFPPPAVITFTWRKNSTIKLSVVPDIQPASLFSLHALTSFVPAASRLSLRCSAQVKDQEPLDCF